MRKDIELHISTGDITLPPQNKPNIRTFQWVERPANMESAYIYGEIILPSHLTEKTIRNNGVYIEMPYTPIYKEMRFRFRFENNSLITNQGTYNEWFDVKAIKYGTEEGRLYASELLEISEDRFYLKIDGDTVRLYSGNECDLNIVNANTQNKNMLLSCLPGNNYRYPTVGVGLVRWTNSNIDSTNFAAVLQEEFSNDGTPVISASYSHELQKLDLILNTSNVDSDGNV